MSTHNIGFYEDLTKIIFELSTNIIKYAPYFFCCACYVAFNRTTNRQNKSHVIRRPVFTHEPRMRKQIFEVSDQVPHKPGCAVTEDSWILEIFDLGSRGIVLSVL